MSVEFLLAAAVVCGLIFWYYRAYREARHWKEVHAAWGLEQQQQAIAIYDELTRQGIRARLKTTGTYAHMMRPFERPQASIRVRHEDFDSAARVVRSLRHE